MKKLWIVLVCGMFVGCEYSVPLVQVPEAEIDGALVGCWQKSGDAGTTDQLLVLPLDRKEYLVSYPAGSTNAMFARACICRVSGKTMVQLKWFGTDQANLPQDNRVFQYASYSVADDKLSVRLLNSDVVKKEARSKDELVSAISANADKPELFKDAMVFTRVKK